MPTIQLGASSDTAKQDAKVLLRALVSEVPAITCHEFRKLWSAYESDEALLMERELTIDEYIEELSKIAEDEDLS